jgi:FkbM family methyltransferase
MAHLAERVRFRLSRLWARLTGAKGRARAAAQARFRAVVAGLGPGDLVIDLGANLGDVSATLAATGAEVIAFEPDPYAFGRLADRLGGMANVRLMNAAAGDRAGVLPLFRHRGFEAAPERRSLASSLLADHAEVGGEPAARVEVVDFPAFVAGLDRDVALVKIDIEGAEVALMEALLDHPAAARIGLIVVETHERALPGLAARTRGLRARTRGQTRPEVNWDWH